MSTNKNGKDGKAKEERTMAVLAIPSNKINIIQAEDSQKFLEEFNKNIPSKEFLDSCREIGKLFGRSE